MSERVIWTGDKAFFDQAAPADPRQVDVLQDESLTTDLDVSLQVAEALFPGRQTGYNLFAKGRLGGWWGPIVLEEAARVVDRVADDNDL